jgi:glucose/arabinose dehydrogenase
VSRRLGVLVVAVAMLAAACGHRGHKVATKRSTTSSSSSSSSSPTGSSSSSSPSSSAAPGATAARPATTSAAPRTTGATAPPNNGATSAKLTKLATLDQPLAAIPVGDALYVAEKTGKVVVLRNGAVAGTVLDISGQVSTGSEQGLLGIAVAGNHLYVDYTDRNGVGNTNVVEYTLSGNTAAAPRTLLTQAQPYANHNGGNVIFGPDGKLYIGLGDGGSAGDPSRNGQNLGTWLGKILRIDPTPSGGQAYTVPADNPFVGHSGAKPEIWAYGLRNPWRFSFDRASGDLWIGDVGQDTYEEVDHAARGQGGQNYEWNLREASHPYNGGVRPAGGVDPVYEYSHNGGNCSITGGYVYRGTRIGGLVGSYLFADFCVGRVFALTGGGARAIGPVIANLSSFAEDGAGEMYVMSLDGGFYRLDAA